MNISTRTAPPGPTATGTAPTGPTLRGLLGAHLMRFRTRAGLALLALGVLFPLAMLVLMLSGGQQTFDLTGADLATPFTDGIFFCALFTPVIGASLVGSLYNHGTIVPVLLVEPRRIRVVVTALVVAGEVALAMTLAYLLLGAAVALPWLASQGVPIGEVLTDPDLWWRILGSTAGVVVLGLLGAALAILLRGVVGPVLVLVGLFVFEGSMIVYVNAEWGHWSFFDHLFALVGRAQYLATPIWQSGLVVAGVLAAVVTAALVVTARRDAT